MRKNSSQQQNIECKLYIYSNASSKLQRVKLAKRRRGPFGALTQIPVRPPDTIQYTYVNLLRAYWPEYSKILLSHKCAPVFVRSLI